MLENGHTRRRVVLISCLAKATAWALWLRGGTGSHGGRKRKRRESRRRRDKTCGFVTGRRGDWEVGDVEGGGNSGASSGSSSGSSRGSRGGRGIPRDSSSRRRGKSLARLKQSGARREATRRCRNSRVWEQLRLRWRCRCGWGLESDRMLEVAVRTSARHTLAARAGHSFVGRWRPSRRDPRL